METLPIQEIVSRTLARPWQMDGYRPPALNPGVRFFKPHEPLNEQCSVGGPPKSSQKGGWDWVTDGVSGAFDGPGMLLYCNTYMHSYCPSIITAFARPGTRYFDGTARALCR